MQYVVDASIASEYLLKTPLGRKVAPILEHAYLIAPSLLDVEVMSVLGRAVRLKKISEERATLAIDDLKNWPLRRISHRRLLSTAWKYRNNLSAYDSFYVAVAKIYDSILIRSDVPLSRAPIGDVVVQNVTIKTV
ncbi:MAG: type II toxin-antitoxin system VapC family toxin [Candidatus Dadabacteria bacterium]|nr:type II toxin-antitoxin system VapC family toxin [Candidatus Dadabacteria bacterium]NIS09606.1 type II toxin-antitoxin system VapC family toxin [Candidatus Dadabacteria bacterium]NIY22781.1 PIN domain-containing protein [Candidatus Dadabacteria bacterium]